MNSVISDLIKLQGNDSSYQMNVINSLPFDSNKESEVTLASNIEVSVVMPAFNEDELIDSSIRTTCETLEKEHMNYELIVVNDGSSDTTFQVAEREAKLREVVKVVGYDFPNRGKGYALKYGAMGAHGEYVVFLDSDSEIDPSNLLSVLKSIQNADMVIVSKRHPLSKVEQPFGRRILSVSFQTLVRLLTGVRASDTQSGLKGFRTECLKQILPLLTVKRYAFDVEVLLVAELLKMKIVELPVKIHLTARFRVKHIIRMAVDLLGITYRLKVRHWYQKNLHNKAAKYIPFIKW